MSCNVIQKLLMLCYNLNNQHIFTDQGGSIGRSKQCDWFLPDEN